jgi:hypothetical protein
MFRRHDTTFAADAVGNREAYADREHALYVEYVGELSKVPTLTPADEVVFAPRKPLPVDFREGWRADARKESRRDPYLVRDEQRRYLEELYAEYECGLEGATKKKTKRKKARMQAPRAATTKVSKRKRRKS